MSSSGRLVSLDVFRGLTIAGMVLVNNPGGAPVYWPLEHAEWHGLTPTDWIFPFFLFIVGISISIALGKRSGAKPDRKTYAKIATRSASTSTGTGWGEYSDLVSPAPRGAQNKAMRETT